MDAANFPILAANIDAIHEPDLYGKIGKHVVVEIGGRKIGIIGYLTTETTVGDLKWSIYKEKVYIAILFPILFRFLFWTARISDSLNA